MQIRARVADSLIHVRGLWFRAMRTAAYTRGIKEFVLEFCTARGGHYITSRVQVTLSFQPTLCRSLSLQLSFPFSFASLVHQARLRVAFVTEEGPLEMIVDRRTRVL